MFVSKFIKLMGHYIRYPVDFLLLPISILFGYLHGIIKAYAMLSLNVVCRSIDLALSNLTSTLHFRAFSGCPLDYIPPQRVANIITNSFKDCLRLMVRAQTAWGSRDGADDDDAYRMIRVTQKHQEATDHWPLEIYQSTRSPINLIPLLSNTVTNSRNQP